VSNNTFSNTSVLNTPFNCSKSAPIPPHPALIVVCGPTATGKSGLAIALAQRLQTVILSADSRQVYRHFDIGTAKPTATEQRQAPHYLIDLCEPTTTLTVAEYQTQAQQLIAAFHTAAAPTPAGVTVPLLVGGTGLYIKAVARGMRIPRVAPQLDLRSQLASFGQPLCHRFLQQVDAAAAAKIHPNDALRTLRALEVFYVTGVPMSQQQGEDPPDYPILAIGLDCLETAPKSSKTQDGDALTDRIRQRTVQMIDHGFGEEVAALCATYGEELPLLNTLGYQEIKRYLAGEDSLDAAIAQTILHTRQFAKRQRTWFRADPQIEWFDANHPHLLEQVWGRVQTFLKTCSQTEVG